jgi:hypothetical protein
MMKLFEKTVLACVFFMVMLLGASCSTERSWTDLKQVSGVNTYIDDSDVKKGIKKSTNTMSLVAMSHQIHEDSGLKCITCHHKKKNDSRIKICVSCHKGVSGSRHFHKFCVECHRREGGPVACAGCHHVERKRSLGEEMRNTYSGTIEHTMKFCDDHAARGVGCDTCHHTDINAEKKKKCGECHSGLSRMRILHLFCKNCHKEKNRELSGKGKAPIMCEGCHNVPASQISHKRYTTVKLPKTGHRKPVIAFNHLYHVERYNTECIDCHHKGGNRKCSDCHMRRDQREIINLKGAYHQQCHDCHRKTAGPKACSRCHIREKG